ncbi:MAG TPA: hypothetical protein VK843_13175 [Planctomycetota bacterium]|nr:hypothetical protein [Planctomycetota bacterium]
MSSTIPRALSAVFALLLAQACASHRPAQTAKEPVHAEPPPVAAEKPAESQKPAPAPATAPALELAAQPGWIAEPPSSGMRKAQFRLPHGAEAGEDASLVVYYSGGQGGSREANIERWVGQFEQPDGSPSADALQQSERKIAGLEVFDAALSGTYIAETAPGSGERVNKPEWRMLASIVETKDGPWYFKLVGPAATVAKWEPSYTTFMNSIRPRP